MYGENLSQTSVSESVSGVVALSLSGVDAVNVLYRLLRNATNVLVYTYVDVTPYVVLMNLPADVVKILPWASVSIGPTGAMPQDFWQKIGAVASTVVNSLVVVGQMIYKGLVALGTFLVNLAEAIVDWGMKALGAVWETIVDVGNKAAQAMNQLATWIFSILQALIDVAFKPLIDAFNRWRSGVATSMALSVAAARTGPPLASSGASNPLDASVSAFVEQILTIESVMMLAVAVLAAVELATKPFNWYAGPVASFVGKYLVKVIVFTIIAAVVGTAVDVFIGNPMILLPSPIPDWSDWIFSISDLIVIFMMHRYLRPDWSFLSEVGRYGPKVVGTFEGLKNILLGLILLTVSSVIPTAVGALGYSQIGMVSYGTMVVLDVVALIFSVHGLNLVRMDKGASEVLVITHAVAEALGVVGVVSALGTYVSDLTKFIGAKNSNTV